MTRKQMEAIPSYVLDRELLRRAAKRSEDSIHRAQEAVEALQKKHLRQMTELRKLRI